MINVLVVGQTPPPFGGQAFSIKDIVEGNYTSIKIFHVRMSFSNKLRETGGFRLGKIGHFFSVIFRVFAVLLFNKINLCYYPPTDGSKLFPLFRDIFLLFFIRLFFPQIKFVFGFHAAGLSESLTKRKCLMRFLGAIVRKAFFTPDGVIQFSEYNPPDGSFLRAKQINVIPGGIQDEYNVDREKKLAATDSNHVSILFVGIIREDKGITNILNAADILLKNNLIFKVFVVGEFVSDEYERDIRVFINNHRLNEHFEFPGILIGRNKWNMYSNVDVFCFPSFAPFESFPRVVLEAMMFKLPVVATRWRGIQGIVDDGRTGFLLPANNSEVLAEKLEILIKNPVLRKEMGEMGREKYLVNFTREVRIKKYEECFNKICQ